MRKRMIERREALVASMRSKEIAGGGEMSRSQANAAIARRLGVSPATLRNWEQGVTAPRGDRLLAMERLYGAPASELLRES